MFCRECGFQLSPVARFCGRCGSRADYNIAAQNTTSEPETTVVSSTETIVSSITYSSDFMSDLDEPAFYQCEKPGNVKTTKIPLFSVEEINLVKDRYITFDVETTGLSNACDRIIQIGAVLYENGEAVDTYATLINPCMHISEAATRVCHITDEMVASAPTEDEVIIDLLDFLGDAVEGKTALVAHNATFDMGFLSAMLERTGNSASIRYVDTLELARRCVTDTPNHKQPTLANYFGVEICNAHRADDDARVCGSIFNCLIEMALKSAQERAQQLDLSIENKGICAYITKQLNEHGQDTSRLRFSILSTGVGLMYPYKLVEFRVSKKWIIRITYRNDDGWEKAEVTQLTDLNDYIDLIASLMNDESNESAFEWYYRHKRNYQQFIESTFAVDPGEIDKAIFIFKSEQLQYLQGQLSKQKDKEEQDRLREERRIERERRKAEEAERKANEPPHYSKRSVAQYDDDMNLIAVFESVTEAAAALNTNTKSIREVANGRQRHAAGFVWKYVDDEPRDSEPETLSSEGEPSNA